MGISGYPLSHAENMKEKGTQPIPFGTPLTLRA